MDYYFISCILILLGNAVINCVYYERCAMIGQTFNLQCVVPAQTADISNFAWSKSRGNTYHEISIFLELNKLYSQKYDVAVTVNSYILTIRNITPDDAGNYTRETLQNRRTYQFIFSVVVAESPIEVISDKELCKPCLSRTFAENCQNRCSCAFGQRCDITEDCVGINNENTSTYANEEGSPSHKDFVSILTLAAVALFVTVTAAVCFVGLKNLYSKKFQKDAYQLETNYYGESKYDEPWNTPNV